MARVRRILCQGRGSAANSAVCYVLGITAVDPARSNLLFERFLSRPSAASRRTSTSTSSTSGAKRSSRRSTRRYGRDRAAMVSEVICYRGKSALREVGKVVRPLARAGRSPERTRHALGSGATTSRQRAARARASTRTTRALRQRGRSWPRELQGFPRHLSIHVGGFVLSAEPLDEVAPVEPARMPGRTVDPVGQGRHRRRSASSRSTCSASACSRPSARRSTLIHAATADRELRDARRRGVRPASSALARDPAGRSGGLRRASAAPTRSASSRSRAARRWRCCRACKPRAFYDLVIEVAIVRPGPIQGGMVHPYLRRRNGEEPPRVRRTRARAHPGAHARRAALPGAGDADRHRGRGLHAAAKPTSCAATWRRGRRRGKLERHRGAAARGLRAAGHLARVRRKRSIEQIQGFGEYGFPESHAAIVRAARLRVGVAQGALPGGVRLRARSTRSRWASTRRRRSCRTRSGTAWKCGK